jgi:hypothetical protein
MDGRPVSFRSPIEARNAGIETVYQNLALSPALSIADNLFLGRERRKSGPLGSVFRLLDRSYMRREARKHLSELGLMTIQNIGQAVETLSGGQRQGVVARAAAFVLSSSWTSRRPRWRQGSRRVSHLDVKPGLPIVLISHNMPHVVATASIHQLGRHLCVIDPKSTMSRRGRLHDRPSGRRKRRWPPQPASRLRQISGARWLQPTRNRLDGLSRRWTEHGRARFPAKLLRRKARASKNGRTQRPP